MWGGSETVRHSPEGLWVHVREAWVVAELQFGKFWKVLKSCSLHHQQVLHVVQTEAKHNTAFTTTCNRGSILRWKAKPENSNSLEQRDLYFVFFQPTWVPPGAQGSGNLPAGLDQSGSCSGLGTSGLGARSEHREEQTCHENEIQPWLQWQKVMELRPYLIIVHRLEAKSVLLVDIQGSDCWEPFKTTFPPPCYINSILHYHSYQSHHHFPLIMAISSVNNYKLPFSMLSGHHIASILALYAFKTGKST